MAADYKRIEEKWQKAWADAKVFEAEPDTRKALLVTAAWPYPNTPQHLGHMRTYGTADVYARYMRMRGYNVLYPMGFHKTGTPILGIAKRIANNDPELIDELVNIFHIQKDVLPKMTDPLFTVDYFSREIEYGMRKAGFCIDWRRSFDSINPLFSKMVEWQFGKLKELGFLTQGTHPLGWCPNENNAVGQHDTKHDVQPEISRVVAIKFKDRDSEVFFPCTTYRPETVYAVTNLFINENSQYVEAELAGAHYYMSKEAAAMLAYQFDIRIIKEVDAATLKAKIAINPLTNEELPVLHGFFVKPDFGTGVVMSVPAHAPFDYVALKRLSIQGIDVPKGPYKSVIGIKGKDANALPSLVYLNIFDWNESAGNEIIEKATKQLYKDEAHNGLMAIEPYKGVDEAVARGKIEDDLRSRGNAFVLYVLANEEPVFCRCGTRAVVKSVSDQWFINYGNEEWKRLSRDLLGKLRIYPESSRSAFEATMDWIEERATERAQGLGTRFPLNNEHIIEPLSDSTIYMCFYTFYHILKANDVKPESLKPEFFDCVLTSKGSIGDAAKATGIDNLVIKACKDAFEYWYTSTSRHSGSDLISNHLTMYIFNHVAVFPKEFWPKQVVANGLLNYEGEKMSKSLGNIIPLKDALEKSGADPVRMVIVGGAELDTDTDYTENAVKGVRSRVDYLFSVLSDMENMQSSELKSIDFWLYSKMDSKIALATQSMDSIMIKSAYNEIFYNSINEIKRYIDRGGSNRLVLMEYMVGIAKMLSPIMPHVSEELWSMLGNKTLLAKEQWPEAGGDLSNRALELCEEIIDRTSHDITQVIALTSKMDANKGKSPKHIQIVIADKWKTEAYNLLVQKGRISDALDALKDQGIEKERVAKYLSQFKNPKELVGTVEVDPETLYNSFADARQYLFNIFNAEVVIEKEKESMSARASRALPQKPSIEVIWG